MAKKVVFSWKIPREDLMEDDMDLNTEFRKSYDSRNGNNGKIYIVRSKFDRTFKYGVYWVPGYMRDLSYFYECTISIKVNNMEMKDFRDGDNMLKTLGEMDAKHEWSDYGLRRMFHRTDVKKSHIYIKIFLRLPDEKKDGGGDN